MLLQSQGLVSGFRCVLSRPMMAGDSGENREATGTESGDEPVRAFACLPTGSLNTHRAVSLTLAEFDIWYNESFVIPEDVQSALKLGSSIRPGMVPINRIVCLVSSTRA